MTNTNCVVESRCFYDSEDFNEYSDITASLKDAIVHLLAACELSPREVVIKRYYSNDGRNVNLDVIKNGVIVCFLESYNPDYCPDY